FPREREVAGAATIATAAQLVHTADKLRIEADPGGEGEPPTVGSPERDPARLRGDQRPGGGDRIERHAECPREDVRVPARKHADDDVVFDAVQHLVEEPVAPEDVER